LTTVTIVTALLFVALPVFAGGSAEKSTTTKQGPVTLSLLVYGAATAQAYAAMTKEYQSETGNTLDFTDLTNNQQTVLRARLNSGNAPDIFMTSAYADDLAYKDYTYNLTNEPFIKDLEPATLSGVTVNGQVTGFPLVVQAYSFIYNKALFAKAGITTLPTTLDQYKAVAEQLQSKGIQPFATGFRDWWVLPQTAWGSLAPTIETKYGGYEKFVNDLNSGALTFEKIPEMSFVSDLLDMVKKYGGPRPSESDYNDQVAKMGAGKVAMIHQGDWAITSIQKIDPKIQLGFLRTPVAAGASKAGIMYDSNITLRVSKTSPYLKQALAFLNWIATSPYTKQTWFPKTAQNVAAVKGAGTPDNMLDEAAQKLIAEGVPTYPWYYQRFPTGLEQGLGVVLQAYTSGQTNREQTLAALDAAYQKTANANK